MWQRCNQVAIFYLTQKVLLVFLGICRLVSSPVVFFADRWPDQFSLVIGRLFPPQYLGFDSGAYLMMFGIILGAHLKLQFANPRSRLLSGFWGAHLSVAMLLFFAGVAWSALPAFWTPGASVFGYLAISLHLGMLGLWVACRPSRTVTVVVLLSIILPMTAIGRGLVAEIATGAEPLLAITMISAQVALLVLLLNHLRKLDEDAPDDSMAQSFNALDFRASTQRNFQRNVSPSNNWLSNMIEARAATRFERATSAPATTPSQRVKLFGLGDNLSSGVWVAQIVFGLMEVAVLLMAGRPPATRPPSSVSPIRSLGVATSLRLV